MHRDILPHVIFSPGTLALQLASDLTELGHEVTIYTPGPVDTPAGNVTADLSGFEAELALRGDTYLDLLKKHPMTFVTLARQVQTALISRAYDDANNDKLDIVHVYANEEEIALPMAALCQKPTVFTHHDPFNFLVKYKSVFPLYRDRNWLSMSLSQRAGMPADTNWVSNIYHGLPAGQYRPVLKPSDNYIAYLGRIIQPKGVHLAIAAVKEYNRIHPDKTLQLKIAGKHYAGHKKDEYWQQIEPLIDGAEIIYLGFLSTAAEKQEFLGNAAALMIPSIFDEPFGMVMIEALACGTPVIGLDSGAIPEVIEPNVTGVLVEKDTDEVVTTSRLTAAIQQARQIDREKCRQSFEARFTSQRMAREHALVYEKLVTL